MTDNLSGRAIVAIVGSKPDPVLPDEVDTMVFCNGSIYLLDRPDVKPRETWHCITNSVLLETKYLAELTRPWLRDKSVDLLIEIASLSPEELDYSWDDFGYTFGDKAVIPNAEKGEITFTFMNRWFYWDLLFAPCPAREKVSAFWNTFWRRKKPAASTGILAVLYALRELGSDLGKTFVISGIGLANDGYEFKKQAYARGHICVDYCVLRGLARSRTGPKVYVTDKRLSDMTGLPILGA